MGSKSACKAKECGREVIAKGYCREHFRLWKRGAMPKPRYKTCTFEKCRRRRVRASLCEEHWTAVHGKAGASGGAQAAPAAPG